jgi:DNA-binding LacI/PurR family transcriptional regulator
MGGPVKESTRKRVLDCARRLNYIPNRIGRTLNTGNFLYPLQKHGFPYVMMRPACFGRDVNHLDLENYQGGQMVAQLFAQRGCSRVAMINGPETHVDAIERERGFFEGLLAAGIKKVTKRYGDFTVPSGAIDMKSIMKEFTPDAIFCANDYMAAGAMKVLRANRLKIPNDVAVVGYDNTDLCLALDPTLTTVDYRAEEVGQCLAQGLLDLVGGKVKSLAMTVRPVLVERESHQKIQNCRAESMNRRRGRVVQTGAA